MRHGSSRNPALVAAVALRVSEEWKHLNYFFLPWPVLAAPHTVPQRIWKIGRLLLDSILCNCCCGFCCCCCCCWLSMLDQDDDVCQKLQVQLQLHWNWLKRDMNVLPRLFLIGLIVDWHRLIKQASIDISIVVSVSSRQAGIPPR